MSDSVINGAMGATHLPSILPGHASLADRGATLFRLGRITRHAWIAARPAVLTFPPTMLLMISFLMFKRFDNDEHQFIASGALLSRRGLLPFRDYPYFHVPNLAFVYAVLDRFSSRLLLNGRLFSCACSAGLLSIMSTLAFRWFGKIRQGIGIAASFAIVAGIMLNPIFQGTSGKAWNHDLPVLLTVGAVLCLWRWRRAECLQPEIAWAATCGLLFGLAVGTRLSFAPAGAAFVTCYLITSRKTRRRKFEGAGIFIAATALALLPSWILLALAPRQFWFGNFHYPVLNTLYRQLEKYPRAMGPRGKVLYLFTDILAQPGNLILMLASIASLAGLSRPRRGPAHPHRFEAGSLLLVCLGLLSGAPVPFAFLFVARVAADERKQVQQAKRWLQCLVLAILIYSPWGVLQYRHIVDFWHTRDWVPMQMHQAGVELAQTCRAVPGPILTYAPIIPLEGGRTIYPEFATGPFVARIAGFVDESDESLLDVVDEDDLSSLLSKNPPAAILTGFEGGLEMPLFHYANQHGFMPVPLKMPGDGEHEAWLNEHTHTAIQKR